MKRAVLGLALIACLVSGASAQRSASLWDTVFRYAMDSSDIASGKSVFQVTTPEIIVQVSKHHFGADMVEVTAVKRGYPVALLRQQAEKIGELVGTPVRGLRVGSVNIGGDPSLGATKATFATDGIIDRDKAILHVTPIIQAFAGAPGPNTVHALTVMFQGEVASPSVLRSYSTAGIRLQAIANENPPAVEYRVQLLSQDPQMLSVPDIRAPEQNAKPTASIVRQNGVDWSLWIALIAAAVAAAVLMYFVMLRLAAKPRR
jgi:hypothetical protein